MGFISLFKTKSVIAVANNVIIKEKIRMEVDETSCSKNKTKNKMPIKGI
ncbi:hypothetical protein NU08_3953 [Flavobacterium anhuiense]|uniref:Uncharacterized protein n=1 Tax=Flavobacterium anhuiense TaxID=459526 RepID=A0A444VTR5_9FLAO|nr:hypothetical protein NU08_3953 [Flavobacterium anhuiense]